MTYVYGPSERDLRTEDACMRNLKGTITNSFNGKKSGETHDALHNKPKATTKSEPEKSVGADGLTSHFLGR